MQKQISFIQTIQMGYTHIHASSEIKLNDREASIGKKNCIDMEIIAGRGAGCRFVILCVTILECLYVSLAEDDRMCVYVDLWTFTEIERELTVGPFTNRSDG